MPYDVELAGKADGIFDSLPVDLAICVNEALYRLADAPLAVGRPSHFPYLPGTCIYDFWCDEGTTRFYVVAFFTMEPSRRVLRVHDFRIDAI